MNVTEKQKEIMLSFMLKYPDFGRGCLRYNSENKRKIDVLWEQLAMRLNMSACGPSKSAKEWSKTWRDWKSNTLKKVAKHKVHMTGTGGGSPKNLQLTAVENALIDFLTPDAASLSNIPEGGLENMSMNNPRQDEYYSSNFSSVQERILKEKGLKENQYYSSTYSTEDESNIDKISLNDSYEDLMLHNISSTKRMQSPIMDKQPKKRNETLVSLDIKEKENIQTKDYEMTPLHTIKYEDVNAKYSQDTKKPKLMTTAINLLEKKNVYIRKY